MSSAVRSTWSSAMLVILNLPWGLLSLTSMQLRFFSGNGVLRMKLEKKIQGLNGIWTRDLAILVRCSNHATKLWSHWCWEGANIKKKERKKEVKHAGRKLGRGRAAEPVILKDSTACETRAHVKITPREKRRQAAEREDFSLSPPPVAFSRVGWFSRPTIPEEKWGTTRSLNYNSCWRKKRYPIVK